MSHWETIGETDEWYTPSYIFEGLDVEFDLDVAHPPAMTTNVPCKKFISENSLLMEWEGFVWMNPPYGGRNSLIPWLEKFVEHGNGICLVPDRTSAPWFQQYISQMDVILFTNGKVKFVKPDGTLGKSPSNGSCIAGIGTQAINSISNSGLGLCYFKESI